MSDLVTIENIENNAYECSCQQRRIRTRWICFHILAVVLFITSYIYAVKYMEMPDRIILMGRAKNIFVGNSESLISKRVLYLIAQQAALTLLERKYDYSNKKSLKMFFSKKAMSMVENYLGREKEFFIDRKITQHLEIEKVSHLKESSSSFKVLIQGFLSRDGVYFGHKYKNKSEFALFMRLQKTSSVKRLPLEVTALKLQEEEVQGD